MARAFSDFLCWTDSPTGTFLSIYLLHASHGKHLRNGRPMHHHSIYSNQNGSTTFCVLLPFVSWSNIFTLPISARGNNGCATFCSIVAKMPLSSKWSIALSLYCFVLYFLFCFLFKRFLPFLSVPCTFSLDFVAQTPAQWRRRVSSNLSAASWLTFSKSLKRTPLLIAE